MSLPWPSATTATATLAMSWGGAGRKRDYRLLDEIGFDVVDARVESCIRTARLEEKDDRYPESKAFRLVAEEFRVNDFNLRMWWRRKRTIIFLTDTDPAEILDLIASGFSCADLALEYDVSVKVVEEWVRTHTAVEDVASAKDAMAEMKFARVRKEIEEAENDIAIKRALAKHSIDKHVAAANSRRYSEDKNIRINSGATTAMEISFVRKRVDTKEE